MTISSIEHALTISIRRVLTRYVSKPNLKLFAFTISLASCLFVGAILTISIFTPYFVTNLKYTQFMINLIGSFISIGMYLPLPLLGYLADYHGPVILSVLSLFMLAPGYFVVASTYGNSYSFEYMLFGFFLIGSGTSALYFTCLLTCAKIYPHFKSLSISGPIACYGMSSFIISELVLKTSYFQNNEDLDVTKVFNFFGTLFVAMSILNWVSSSIVTIEKDLFFDELEEDQREEQEQENEATALLATESNNSPQDSHHTKFQRFLRDKSMYLLLISLLFCVGPMESFIVNISSFSDILQLNNSSELMKFSFCSTFARLFFGIFLELIDADLFRKIIIILVILAVELIGSIATFESKIPSVISSMFGIAYGGIFTIYPTMLANIWGVDIFGSTWGLFMLAPAFGSILFGLVYGLEYDARCGAATMIMGGASTNPELQTVNCLYSTFMLISIGLVAAAVSIIIGWKVWWCKRNL